MRSGDSIGLRNIGPETEVWFHRIGVSSREQFEKLGAEKVYILLLEAGHEPDEGLRFMLKGAEEDVDWHILAQREKSIENSYTADIDES
ncbi:MAG TPA: TfoX/Sxy family DNA transformation protein [Candidatus Saccharimonadales bacterium]|nr:TfoX/Sxy family DNA transformation protein [Candidatus Saccharimonadales bacterium]